ncbi:MAG: hypothetical protein Q8J89_01060 [Caulobacter sp.]|nr:hypothetical protein [Caulobacter sp.]
MTGLATQALDLAISRFPATLAPADAPAILRTAAPRLASGPQLYFECRLAGDARAVDVSQHFFADRGDGPRLLALALRQVQRGQGESWARLADFAEAWSASPALAGAIPEIGLEHDLGGDGQWVAAPAVFAAFRDDTLTDRDAGERFVATVAPAAAEGWRRLVATMETARAHGLVPGRMAGVMLSRDAQLRCMLRGLTPAAVGAFFRTAGWSGEREPLLTLLAEPPLATEATRLVLGFGPDLLPDCGLEVIHARGAAGEAGRGALLAWLVERGLADRARVRSAAAWAGRVAPMDTQAPWPAALIARDLTAADGRLEWFDAFLSHVKLNFIGGRLSPAKIYLGLCPMGRLEQADHA